MLCSTRL